MTVEEIYNKKYIEKLIETANKKDVKDSLIDLYNECKKNLDNHMSIEEFACNTYGFNPSRTGIGELSQIEKLKEKYPNIIKLNSAGPKAIRLNSFNDKLIISECKKSNVNGIKSFDAISKNDENITLFILKCVDFGDHSKSKGGGHQTNVLNELIKTINVISSSNFIFLDKNVLFHIVIDGRSSAEFIKKCKIVANNNIKITDSNNA